MADDIRIIEEALVIDDRGVFASVGAQVDVDGDHPRVIYKPKREGRVEIHIDPYDVPRLTKQLNKAAKYLKGS